MSRNGYANVSVTSELKPRLTLDGALQRQEKRPPDTESADESDAQARINKTHHYGDSRS